MSESASESAPLLPLLRAPPARRKRVRALVALVGLVACLGAVAVGSGRSTRHAAAAVYEDIGMTVSRPQKTITVYLVCGSGRRRRLYSNDGVYPSNTLEYLIAPYSDFEFEWVEDYTSVAELLDAASANATLLRAGSAVMYDLRSEIVTRSLNESAAAWNYSRAHTAFGSNAVDNYCAYQFAPADPLLLAPSVQRLLAFERPLILIETSDWACRTHTPPTIHQQWRTSYGADGVGSHANFLPYGTSEFAASFYANASIARDVPIAARGFLVSFVGSTYSRKPERDHFRTLMRDGMKGELTDLARRHGLDGVVYDMTNVLNGSAASAYTYEAEWNTTYEGTLARSRFVASLAGDVWSGTELWNVLEFGAIPVVERRASFKGCVDPTGWLRESGAPVVWVDDWSELPTALNATGLGDDAALEARRRALARWWAAAKRELGASMGEFAETWRDETEFPRNDCSSVALSDAQEAGYRTELSDFYAREHWFDNFHDSPWFEAAYCWKEWSDAWSGLQCYSPMCAEPVTASFSCGNTTLTADTSI